MLEAALAAGIGSAGGDALLGGVLPTPAAPLLVGRYGFDLAVVLSASHNPYARQRDQVLRRRRLQALRRDRAGDRARAGVERRRRRRPAIGRIRELRGRPRGLPARAAHALSPARPRRRRRRCWTAPTARPTRSRPEIFRRLGARVTVLADAPDGRNINDGCGSTHIERWRARCAPAGTRSVSRSTATATACWRSTARGGRRRRRAAGAGDAASARSRAPERRRRRRHGDDQLRLSLGDGRGRRRGRHHRRSATATCSRSCARAAGRSGASSPATSSRWASTAPATASPARCWCSRRLAGRDLRERDGDAKAAAAARQRPRARPRRARRGATRCRRRSRASRAALRGRGRVLVRPSGTEPLVRVMVEAPTDEEADAVCGRLVALVERELGIRASSAAGRQALAGI